MVRGGLAAPVRSEYAALPSRALFSQRCDPKSPGQTRVAIPCPPGQTPGTVFIIHMVISGLHSYVVLN